MEQNLYLKGEEKFGRLTSGLYSKFSGVSSNMAYGLIRTTIVNANPSALLDVGCGPGDILARVALENSEMKLYGTDPSPHMVEIANRRISRSGMNNRVSVRLGSSRNLPFDRKFDMIISSFSFHHWKGQKESLELLLAALNPSGKLAMFELNSRSFPGRFPFVKSHAMSKEYAMSFNFPGYVSRVEFSDNFKIISLVIEKR